MRPTLTAIHATLLPESLARAASVKHMGPRAAALLSHRPSQSLLLVVSCRTVTPFRSAAAPHTAYALRLWTAITKTVRFIRSHVAVRRPFTATLYL